MDCRDGMYLINHFVMERVCCMFGAGVSMRVKIEYVKNNACSEEVVLNRCNCNE